MKLISKYNRFTLPVIIIILITSGLLFYYILHYILLRQVDKDLRIEQSEIVHFVNEKKNLPETADYKDQQIAFIPSSLDHFQENFTTIHSIDKTGDKEAEDESFRRLQFLIKVDGKKYIAEVTKSQQETEDIVTIISLLTLSIIAFLLIALAIINRFILANIWRPFYNSLKIIRHYKISVDKTINFSKTDIDEFAQMQSDFTLMVEKATNDYRSLKTFTENASHEMQTPLAIMRNKLEIFSQDIHLDKNQSKAIQSVNEAINRLSRLNESLLLLSKIENNYFNDTETVNFSKLLETYLEDVHDLMLMHQIKLTKEIKEAVFVKMSFSLAEILISNLIVNAIKHNYKNGEIIILLDKNEFEIINTGKDPNLNPDQLFERFRKDSNHPDSIGLGLSIVKKIADAYSFKTSYKHENRRHVVTLFFKND